jgi:large subunit ribosomal protein L16
MLMPKRTKYRKPHSTSYDGKATKGNYVAFGDFGLQAQEGSYITANQIEAARIALSRYTKRSGQVWIRIFPHLSRTRKPAEVRMGSGKGAPDHFVAVVKAGTVMFEIGGVDAKDAKAALISAGHKVPVLTKILVKQVKAEK